MTVLVLRNGEYRVEKGDTPRGEGVYKPTKIIGQGRGLTTLVGVGLYITGNKSDGIVEIQDLTIKGGERSGLVAYDGMKVIMRGCTIERIVGRRVCGRTERTSPATTSK